ncbi:ankyrin repeat domain-containing protein [Desulfomonile tiedjei]|uniref:Ankyrin repeat-containing protein n=1 Tax=Desulfomonile tiedjei (strain ATCC 49306 / DSM 6799 / DCB-1) TaxID=706587 RepID=I4C7S1_DESTA|nr:ankyrin repeat domain-containing protein [Desulfomonile tiedjei]AFM25612.1 ankyrin repeat-containing protein [Desulfomonile tiedjei DSM 6799]
MLTRIVIVLATTAAVAANLLADALLFMDPISFSAEAAELHDTKRLHQKELRTTESAKPLKNFKHAEVKAQQALTEQLSHAIEEENIDEVKALLAKGADVNRYDGEGKLPLEKAAGKGSMALVRILWHSGADPNISNRDGQKTLKAAFIEAVSNCHQDVARYFLNIGVNVNAARPKEGTLFQRAARCSREFAEFLLERGAAEIDLKTARLPLERDANLRTRDEKGWTSLHEAVWEGHLDKAALLLDNKAEPNAVDSLGWTPLILAAWKGQPEAVNLLISRGADIRVEDAFGKTAFVRAVEMGHRDAALLLLNKGADVNTADVSSWTPIMAAVTRKDREMVKLLRERGAKMTVAAAVLLEDEREMQRLLKESAKKGVQIADASMALLIAVRNRSEKVVRHILDKCPEMDIKEPCCDTALLFAIENKYSGIAEILLEKGANPNAADHWRKTALHYAVWKGDLRLIRMLLEKGAHVNAQTIGWDGTPLMGAVERANVEIVKLLLQNGASLRVGPNSDDLWIAAEKSGNKEVLEMLKAHALKHPDQPQPTSREGQ